jgi:Arc/MetJ family transcription regulator
MRTTITIDDTLYQQALKYSDANIRPKALIDAALRAYIRVKAGRHLSNMGGKSPNIQTVSRA